MAGFEVEEVGERGGYDDQRDQRESKATLVLFDFIDDVFSARSGVDVARTEGLCGRVPRWFRS